LRLERDKNAVNVVQKQPTTKYLDTDLQKYYFLLTPYAFDLVKKHFLCDKAIFDKYISDTTCDCSFHNAMKLPCHHIFNVRRKLKKPLYNAELCDHRWTREMYLKSQRVFIADTAGHINNDSKANCDE